MFNDFVFFLNTIDKPIVDSIRFENSDNYWIEYQYDEKGNQIEFKNSNCIWKKYQYNMNNVEFIK